MKINEIVKEGFWDSIKKGANVAADMSGLSGTPAGRFHGIGAGFASGLAKDLGAHGLSQSILNKANATAQQAKQAQRAATAAAEKQAGAVMKPNPNRASNQPEMPEAETNVLQPGEKFVIIDPNSKVEYYKTNRGWFTAIGNPVTIPSSINYLENTAQQQRGRFIPAPKIGPKLNPKQQRRADIDAARKAAYQPTLPPKPVVYNKPRPQAATGNYSESNEQKTPTPTIKESTLVEGGNVFSDVSPIKQKYVRDLITDIRKIVPKGVDIIPDIGSAGYKVESGDMDVFVDAGELSKLFNTPDEKYTRLALKQYVEKQGFEVAQSGRNVHVKMPVPDGSFVQVDLMVIPNAAKVAPFHTHGPSGQYNDQTFKGGQLFVLYASIAKALGLKFSPFEGKLVDRITNKVVADNKDSVAKILLNPSATANDLANIKTIMKALASDPQKDAKLAQAKEDEKKGLIKLPESKQAGTSSWFRTLSEIVTPTFEYINQENEGGSLEGYVVNTDQPNLRNYLKSHGTPKNLILKIENSCKRIGIIRNLYVNEDLRNKGFGNNLMHNAIDDAYMADAEAVILVADTVESNNFNLVNWYENYGFETIGYSTSGPVMLLKE